MDYSKEEFVHILEYKKNVMTMSKLDLRNLYSSKEKYMLFLTQTLMVLENECVIYLLDDSIKDKIYDLVNHYRFIHRDKELFDQANEIIAILNSLSGMTNTRENEVIDEYICMHEDLRNLYFSDLEDFIKTISQDYDCYLGLKANDTNLTDDITFMGAVSFFLAAKPEIMTEQMLETAKIRCEKIMSTKVFFKRKIRSAAKFTLNILKEEKNQT